MQGATLITSGVGYDQLLKDIEAICERVCERALEGAINPDKAATSELGGVELAQEVTRLSKSRIYNLVSERGIPHSKRGNKLYFSRGELRTWVENGKRDEK